MTKAARSSSEIGLLDLWRQFIPLSLSDVAMALGDPMLTTALAHLPEARVNLAAVGIAKSLAIFFESPIITILHTSNALAPSDRSRRALWRFTLIAGGGLSILLLLLALPSVFAVVGGGILAIPPQFRQTVRAILALMFLWPFAIAWRRYFQGLLIHSGHSQAVAAASIGRLTTVAGVLLFGFSLKMPGGLLAASALIAGVIAEAIAVTVAHRK
jgi:progressive ankylosis protein